MVLAHQNLDQLSERLRATIMASTSIKFAGGVSARDADAFAREMRCDPEFVQSMRKQAKATEFACWVKNGTPQAIRLAIPLGVVNEMPTLNALAYTSLVHANRSQYCGVVEHDNKITPMFPCPRRASFELGKPEPL